MRKVTLKIPNDKFSFFMELIKNLGFVKIEEATEGDTNEEITNNLRQGFEEMKQIKEGKIKTTPAKDFLDEL